MLVSEAINAAGRKLGLIVSGESFTAAELADGLLALQSMLRSWAAEQINVFASTRETHTLTAGTFEYTWGSGGDINSARPNKLLEAFITDSNNVSNSVEVIGSAKYNALTLKTVTGTPGFVYPHYLYPLVKLYLYPVPDATDVLNLESLKPFTETSSFSATGDTIAVPSHYEEAIIYNLAVRLAPEFSAALTGETVAIAASSFKRIQTLNSSNSINEIALSFPAGRSGRYSINLDSY